MSSIPFISIGNRELKGNEKLIPGETKPCRNCGMMCTIKSTTKAEVNGIQVDASCSIETIKCDNCGKIYLMGVGGISLGR